MWNSCKVLPVGVWSYLLHERSGTLEHFQRICHIEEVELHVDWRGRVLPGLKGFCAILQDCSLQQEKGTSAVDAIVLHDRRERNSMPWEQAQAVRLKRDPSSRSALLWSSSLNIHQARHLLSWAALLGLQFHPSPQTTVPGICQKGH